VPQVTCPRCDTRQEAGDGEGYTCVSCETAWAFATCENCAVRFHMRPGTSAWTCPECGHENGIATMVDLGADREPASESFGEPAADELEPLAEPASGARERFAEPGPFDEPEPAERAAAGPRHAVSTSAPERSAGPPTRTRLATIAVIGIAAVLIAAFAISALADNGSDTAGGATPTTSSSTPAPSSSLTTTEQLCLHLGELQLLRVDNYTRVAAELADDEAAIQASGDAKLAAAVTRMRTAVLAYRDALAAQADMTDVSAQIGKASHAMPCS